MRLKRRSLLMLDLRIILIRLSQIKNLSAVLEITGRVQRIVTRALMLGQKLKILVNVEERVEGSEFEP